MHERSGCPSCASRSSADRSRSGASSVRGGAWH
jgi:hypothetical protein